MECSGVAGVVSMGVLTDFVVVDRAEAQRVANSAYPSREFKGIDAKGIDIVKAGMLHALLARQPYDLSFVTRQLMIESDDDDERCAFELPLDFVQSLASLDALQIKDVAAKWLEMAFSPKFDNWGLADVEVLLLELSALCQRAVREHKVVLMWMCP